jgi:hypothetical protein
MARSPLLDGALPGLLLACVLILVGLLLAALVVLTAHQSLVRVYSVATAHAGARAWAVGRAHPLRAWATRWLSARARILPTVAAPPLRPHRSNGTWGLAGGAAPVRVVAADPASPTAAGCAAACAAGGAVGDRGDVSGPDTCPATHPVPVVPLRRGRRLRRLLVRCRHLLRGTAGCYAVGRSRGRRLRGAYAQLEPGVRTGQTCASIALHHRRIFYAHDVRMPCVEEEARCSARICRTRGWFL